MTKTYGFNIQHTYRNLPKIFFSEQKPYVFSNASFKLFNADLANNLNLNKSTLQTNEGVQFLLGNTSNAFIKPLSMAYAGHQYEHFNILGDGRAHLLLEHLSNHQIYDIHLKGSGQTAFSRGFDGRATMRSALLEYLMSEAMHAMNIPTTRSLAVIHTGDKINRIGLQDAAVLVRVAKSHLRVGTFEYAVYKEDPSALKALTDYAIKRHDSDLEKTTNPYLSWYKRIIKRQAKLIAQWQTVGFVHGVMNTDNTTISGETIDYGPCAFIDQYDLKAVYSSIDTKGRYAYGNQPYIGSWNLAKLGQMMLPLINDNHDKAIKAVQEALGAYGHIFENYYYSMMANKLGISKPIKSDHSLIETLLKLMETHSADYTETLTSLTFQNYPKNSLFNADAFKAWERLWQDRIKKEATPYTLMKRHNPVIIPRNHLVKQALDKAVNENDFEPYNALLTALSTPFNAHSPDIYRKAPETPAPFVTYCGT